MKLVLASFLVFNLVARSMHGEPQPDTQKFLHETLNPKGPYNDPDKVIAPKKFWFVVILVLAVVTTIGFYIQHPGYDPLHKDGVP